ncbi:MAG: ADP-ribosylglycohydrolase family protein [Xanthomonadales bacterium]|nr:ADP-ribosylglycohydrolase family protein [Xanthomonadales bacterium]
MTSAAISTLGSRVDPALIRSAWAGRVSGCLLGKPLEVLSFRTGRQGVLAYLEAAGALPLRDYVPATGESLPARLEPDSCRGRITRAEPDDDINYTVLALLLLEQHGLELKTEDVARAWLRRVPAGRTWTAERAAYRVLLENMDDEFVNGADPGFDLDQCADNAFNEWIGGQIRADLYGWVTPGQPALAARFATRDARLSHRGDGIFAAAFIAALAAALPAARDLDAALDEALVQIPGDSGAAEAVHRGRQLAGEPAGCEELHRLYAGLSPVHALNNLALVVWSLCSHPHDFSAAVGEVVSGGWDTDSNGATVGGLSGIAGNAIPAHWTQPWNGRIAVTLAGQEEWQLETLVEKTVNLARQLEEARC